MATLVGKPVSTNGLGLMKLTPLHGAPIPDDQSFKVLKAALAAGSNVWNAADFYGPPGATTLHLLNRYFTKYPEDADKVVLCVKTGVVDMRTFQIDGSPEFMRQGAENALKILDGKKSLDIFGCCRVDKNVPIEKTVEGLAKLISEGKIGGIQLSEVNSESIRRAAKIHKIEMVEEEASLFAPDIFQNGIVETCGELGIVVVAHTPLGSGMLTGEWTTIEAIPQDNHHRFFPRFQQDTFYKNLELVEALRKIALAKNCSMAQLALSWLKSHNGAPGMPLVIPIAGTRSEARIRENCADIQLAPTDLAEINAILERFPVVGGRYPPAGEALVEY